MDFAKIVQTANTRTEIKGLHGMCEQTTQPSAATSLQRLVNQMTDGFKRPELDPEPVPEKVISCDLLCSLIQVNYAT